MRRVSPLVWALVLLLLTLPAGQGLCWYAPTLDVAAGAGYSSFPKNSPTLADDELSTRGRMRFGVTAGTEGDWPPLVLEGAYELNGFGSDEGSIDGAGGGLSGGLPALRVDDPERELGSGGHHFVGQNLDRLSVTWYGEAGTLTLGRQAVGHGSGRFFNPGDIFAPVAPQGLYSEYKSGIDGARFTVAVGEEAEWELMWFIHDERDDSYLLARGAVRLGGVDVAGYGGQTLGAATAGLDLALDWLGAGWYLDSVARFDRSLDRTGRIALGVHNRFAPGVNVFAELFFNGPGSSRPEEYFRALSTPEAKNGELFLLARRYLALEADYEFHPLVTAAAVTVVNLDDSSLLLQPLIEWSATAEVGVTVGASVGVGEGPGRFGVAKSEFGSYPDTLFIEVRTAF